MSVKEQLEALAARKLAITSDSAGTLTARERISALVDEDSFVEIDSLAKRRRGEFAEVPASVVPAEGAAVGYATVCGRPVYVYSQDYACEKGAVGEMQARKICKVLDMAKKNGCPVIAFLDSDGIRLAEGMYALAGMGEIFAKCAKLSGIVPQITVLSGPCVGGAAVWAGFADFVIATPGSRLYLNPAQVLESFDGAKVADEKYFDAQHRAADGSVSLAVADDAAACDAVRSILSYLPQNNIEYAPCFDGGDDPNRVADLLNEVLDDEYVPGDVREVLAAVADNGIFTELGAAYAPAAVTGFMRLGGAAVGVVANQGACMEGYIDGKTACKLARFVGICDSYNIPVVSFVNTAGFKPGYADEVGGEIKAAAKLFAAYSEADTPKVTVIIGKAYGAAGLAMGSYQVGADMVYAWPCAEISAMKASGAATVLFSKEIAAAADPIAKRSEVIARYRDELASPFAAAAAGYVDDVIEPAVTRPVLISALQMVVSKSAEGISKKHSNPGL